MNPQTNDVPGMQLPAPVSNQQAAIPVPAGQAQPFPNQATGVPSVAPAQPLISSAQTGVSSQLPSQNDVSKTTNTASPKIADDGDLIEKEWVNKAKAIVEHNRDDPYKQSEELTVVKADYMKQRYNKTIKVKSSS